MKNQAGLPTFHTEAANSSEKIKNAAVQQNGRLFWWAVLG
jgi:hypothetical protein